MTTATWIACPNLRAFSLSEGLKLTLIVGSLSTVFLAGQLAQSRNQGLTEAAQRTIVTAIATTQSQVVHRPSAADSFAHSQIRTFTDVLDGLTERAEALLETHRISQSDAEQIKTSLRQLDEDLMAARVAYARYNKTKDAFSEEELRETLIAVQDSASRAQGQLITLDQPDQGFKVSLTGQ